MGTLPETFGSANIAKKTTTTIITQKTTGATSADVNQYLNMNNLP